MGQCPRQNPPPPAGPELLRGRGAKRRFRNLICAPCGAPLRRFWTFSFSLSGLAYRGSRQNPDAPLPSNGSYRPGWTAMRYVCPTSAAPCFQGTGEAFESLLSHATEHDPGRRPCPRSFRCAHRASLRQGKGRLAWGQRVCLGIFSLPRFSQAFRMLRSMKCCAADPGSIFFDWASWVPCLHRTTHVLQCARDGGYAGQEAFDSFDNPMVRSSRTMTVKVGHTKTLRRLSARSY